jgi:penicillin-binding protein 1C
MKVAETRKVWLTLTILVLPGILFGTWFYHRTNLITPPHSWYLTDREGVYIGEISMSDPGELGYWSLKQVPERVIAATLVAEDRRFWSHAGVDPLAVFRAVRQNMLSGERQSGASTLAMQVARLQNPGSRTYLRKMVEAGTALGMTFRHGRQDILRQYLTLAPYGNNIHGIACASRKYFNKPVNDLSWAEIVFLTSLPQAPSLMNPYRYDGRLKAIRRGDHILDRLLESGCITQQDYTLAKHQLAHIVVLPRPTRPESMLHVLARLKGVILPDLQRKWNNLAPVITTSFHAGLQKRVEWEADKFVKDLENRGAGNAAVMVIDLLSNEILASVGSTGFFDEKRAGSINYTTLRRSPGSTLKPFIYALALEQGVLAPNTILDDINRGAGAISNSDERYLGPLLPRVALANSRNVPAANILQAVGLNKVYDFLGELDLHDGRIASRQYGVGLAVGGMPVTLEKLVRAYTVLARDGAFSKLHWIRSHAAETGPKRMQSETARLISLILSDPMARLPTFPRMGASEYTYPVAVKTGTSSNYKDAWTVAYSSRYLVGAWIGHPDYRSMNRLSGYRSAAKLVKTVMNHIHENLDGASKPHPFLSPRGFVPVEICALTGKRATWNSRHVFLEWFAPGTEPVNFSEAYVPRPVDIRTGCSARPETPAEFIEVKSVLNLDTKYARWIARAIEQHNTWDPQDVRTPRSIGYTEQQEQAPDEIMKLKLISPSDGLCLIRDPETPQNLASLAMEAVVTPPPQHIVWYVDDQPFETAEFPFSTRWHLIQGEHNIHFRVPENGRRSASVRVIVL